MAEFDPHLGRERSAGDQRLLQDHEVRTHNHGTTRRQDVYRAGSYVEVLTKPFDLHGEWVVEAHVAGDFFFVPVSKLAESEFAA